MPPTIPPEDQLAPLIRALRVNTIALVMFAVAVVIVVAATIAQHDHLPTVAIPLVLIATQASLTLRRRRGLVAARSRLEAAAHQDHTSSATPDGR